MENTKKLNRIRILIFLVITFALTCGYCFLVIYPMINGKTLTGIPAMATQLLVAAGMFCPAVGVLITRLITGEGFRDCWLKPNLKKNIRFYLLAWFGPAILTLAGTALYFLLFPENFDLSFSYFIAALEATGAPLETLPMPIGMLMLVQCVQALLLAPIMNFFTCFGEEWGWRGYLLPKMKDQLPTLPMLLVNGVIWGLWHAPLTVIGHNYGVGYPGFPYAGIAMMCLFCTVLGVFLSYITLKTGSCIPAVLSHGAINGFAAIGIYFTKDGGNPFVGPAPMGIIGLIPFLIAAVFMAISLCKAKKEI